MERMPEFRREPERPKEMQARIEGRIETSFAEIDPDQTQPIPLHDVTWGDTSLTFQRVGRSSIPTGPFGMDIPVELYTGQLEYKPEGKRKRKANLSLTTSKDKPVLFTGTRNGFYAHDPLMKGRGDPFYVVGIQIDELEENMSRLAAVYHELGHTLLFDTDADIQLLQAAITRRKSDLPPIRMAQAFGAELARAIPDSVRQQFPAVSRGNMVRMEARIPGVGRGMSLFHERNAWAAGMNVVRDGNFPTGFEYPTSYFDYARLCLSSYGRHYRDNRFVNGWR